ncbi:hypothetical protein B0T22DRAFT_381460 [Podospora appendiculata]|uniref:DUF6536 domain-containing protein n=1 Tax=Podospora appendiculata TaxID=314037 RepID=A0AAE0X629_9PEZI|nr:hypothetical protein B0T22DRAFT_381460 [Podospora appendiculata]
MEIVIPPRDHGPSTFHYTWDENGEVTQITRVQEAQSITRERLRRGRQTVQWPFQSIVTETEIPSPTTTSPVARRATWQQPKRARDDDSDSISQDIIPDYVVNFIRGETPETVARRKRNGGYLSERAVDIAHQHRPHQSRVADFEGFLDENSSRTSAGGGSDEERHNLTGSREKSIRSWRRLTVGWRAGVGLNLLLSLVILVTSLVGLVLAITEASVFSGNTVIFAGSCTKADHINWGLHAVTSVFAVILVAGANYVFQILGSPTRTEVAVAHQRKRWLDIGIPSLRNLAYIENSRTFLAVIVLASALFAQIIYSAVVFTSQNAVDYKLVLVTESFLDGAQFSNDTSTNNGKLSRLDILSLQDQGSRGQLVNLTTAECFQEFSGTFEMTFDAALLVTDINSQTSSLLQTSAAKSTLTQPITGNSISELTRDQSSVLYCLAHPADQQTCEVNLNGPLLLAVAILNLVTVVVVAVVLLKTSFAPLATLGDAVSSFLKEPDPTTRGSCLLTKSDVWQGRWGFSEAKYWVPTNYHWFQTPTLPRWMLALVIWGSCIGLAAAALACTMIADPNRHLSAFGVASPYSIITLSPSTTSSTIASALLASLPQALLAALYLATNSLMTTYFLSHESSLFVVKAPRPLRVSADPEGAQITSLYLTLPRPASWFLVIIFAAMGFVLSQSFFVVILQLTEVPLSAAEVSPSSDSSGPTTFIALGLSGVALLVFLAILVLLAIVVVGLGFLRFTPTGLANGQAIGNPMAMPGGTCSAVISSRCHRRQTGEMAEPWGHPLVWGVVREGVGMNVSHCTFTAGVATQLDMTRSYA